MSTQRRVKKGRVLLMRFLAVCMLMVCASNHMAAQVFKQANLDAGAQRKIDSSNIVAAHMALRRDSAAKATAIAIALRDSINTPPKLRPEQIRAERREHAYAAGAVALLATLTFFLYNLRTN